MLLINDETGEEIPIPEDSHRLFLSYRDIKQCTPIPMVGQALEVQQLVRTNAMRLERGSIHIRHGYNLLQVLEFLFQTPKTLVDPILSSFPPHLQDALKGRALKVTECEIDVGARIQQITIKAHIL